jgi:uncharacterized protein
MRIIRKSEHVTVPWKNGGGTATDIVAEPEGAGFDAFDWRLSGAHVGRAGPFSLFPHVDRTMLILRGEALVIHGLPGGDVTLTRDSAPFDFPGDVQVSATVPGGPIDNLNVMVDRRRFRSVARRAVIGRPETIRPRGVLLIYCERGVTTVGNKRLAEGDTLMADKAVTLESQEECNVIVVEIWAK